MSAPSTAIVVGAGLGGLSAAVGLAARGVKVDLFEANNHLGGKLNILHKEGFAFDLGPSIFILPEVYREVFRIAGRKLEDYVGFVTVEPQWRSFFEDGKTVDLWGDDSAMREELSRLGGDPDEWSAFSSYCAEQWSFAEKHYLGSKADSVGDVLRSCGVGGLLSSFDVRDFFGSMNQSIRRRVSQPHLGHVLDFFIKYVGSSAYDAPGVMNLLAWSQLKDGLFYVPGGMYGYAEALEKLLEELGVTVHLGTPVEEIRTEGKRVSGIVTDKGDLHEADVVVSNMEVIPTYQHLLGESESFLKRYRKKFAPAASGLVLHLGVGREYEQLGHHNFFFSADPERFLHQIHREHKLPDDPTIYVVYPTRTDPERAPQGSSIVKVLPHIPPLQDQPFSQDEYLALRERVLDKLERMGLTDLRAETVYEHLWTPHDIEENYRSHRGAIYGVVTDRWKNFALKAPKKSPHYNDLWFVGGSVNPGGGTPMVLLCGQQVAEMITSGPA
jgi:diapolycopene oxygenase